MKIILKKKQIKKKKYNPKTRHTNEGSARRRNKSRTEAKWAWNERETSAAAPHRVSRPSGRISSAARIKPAWNQPLTTSDDVNYDNTQKKREQKKKKVRKKEKKRKTERARDDIWLRCFLLFRWSFASPPTPIFIFLSSFSGRGTRLLLLLLLVGLFFKSFVAACASGPWRRGWAAVSSRSAGAVPKFRAPSPSPDWSSAGAAPRSSGTSTVDAKNMKQHEKNSSRKKKNQTNQTNRLKPKMKIIW